MWRSDAAGAPTVLSRIPTRHATRFQLFLLFSPQYFGEKKTESQFHTPASSDRGSERGGALGRQVRRTPEGRAGVRGPGAETAPGSRVPAAPHQVTGGSGRAPRSAGGASAEAGTRARGGRANRWPRRAQSKRSARRPKPPARLRRRGVPHRPAPPEETARRHAPARRAAPRSVRAAPSAPARAASRRRPVCACALRAPACSAGGGAGRRARASASPVRRRRPRPRAPGPARRRKTGVPRRQPPRGGSGRPVWPLAQARWAPGIVGAVRAAASCRPLFSGAGLETAELRPHGPGARALGRTWGVGVESRREVSARCPRGGLFPNESGGVSGEALGRGGERGCPWEPRLSACSAGREDASRMRGIGAGAASDGGGGYHSNNA